MDPISAVVNSANFDDRVITFVEFSYTFIRNLYFLYDSGTTKEYDELDQTCQEMQGFAVEMMKTLPTKDPSRSDLSVGKLAEQCYMISTAMHTRIAKTKTAGGKMGELFKAALKAICSRSEINSLQVKLENCRSQLHLQYAVAQGTSTKQSLDRLETAVSAYEEVVESAQAVSNERAILTALKFELIDDRFQNVAEAAESTYEWIFDDALEGADASKPEISFKQWLSQGDGFFHISGKPGSGKSTLMKFVFNHPQTREELLKWSGSKTLVFVNYFFWRPGNILQRSLLGLIRSLMYSVASQCPEVIPTAFQQRWNPSLYHPWALLPPLDLSSQEILRGFDILLKSAGVFEKCQFCFFIDGLDEFDEDVKTHTDLVRCLQDWIVLSDGRLKICVSSRELPTFLDRLPSDQRIRLQDLTNNDIWSVIDHGLDGNDHFQALQLRWPDDCAHLKSRIRAKADGVFLWATMTLKMLFESLEQRDSLTELFEKIESLPEELEDFFRFILDSIPKDVRKKAYCSLLYALSVKDTVEGGGRSSYQSNLYSSSSLLRWSFLDDYINDDENFLENFSDDQGDMQPDAIVERMASAAAQLRGRCRGLMELRHFASASSYPLDMSNSTHKPLLCYATFTHRSIPELLTHFLASDASSKYIGAFDPYKAGIQTHTVLFRLVPLERFASASRSDVSQLLMQTKKSSTPEAYFPYLFSLEKAILRRLTILDPWYETSPWDAIRVTPLGVASYQYYYEFVVWSIKQDPTMVKGRSGTELMREMMDAMEKVTFEELTIARSKQAVSEILQLGIDPNQQCLIEGYDNRTLWVLLLQRMNRNGPTPYQWSAVEAMLERGAHPPYWTRCTERDMRNKLRLQVGDEEIIVHHPLESNLLPVSLGSPGGKATLWDFIDKYEDDTYQRDFIRQLLRKSGHDRPREEVGSPTADVAKLLETWRNASSIALETGFWVRLKSLMTSPVLPWLIIGNIFSIP